jgi:hypothetical protein
MQKTASRGASADLFASPKLEDVVPTDVHESGPSRFGTDQSPDLHRRWHRFVDNELIEWGRDPMRFEDEGIPAPSKNTIRAAIRLVHELCERGFPPPTRIVPDACGGIVFERRLNGMFESIRISADGNVEYCLFDQGSLVRREPWLLPPLDRK